jgi:uncharacterized delta-60 repeat protein
MRLSGQAHFRGVALAVVLVAGLSASAAEGGHARPGTLDRTFGEGGKALTRVGKARVFVGGLVNGPGGGFYVAANTGGPPRNEVGGRLLLLRYDRRGRLVRRFGKHGVASFSLAQGPATVGGLARERDGALVMVGSVAAPGSPGNRALLVGRVTSRGKLDPSFGTGGVVATDVPGLEDAASGVAVEPDGGLVVVGSTTMDYAQTPAGRSGDLILTRYLSDGRLDQGFGNGGIVTRTGDDYGSYLNGRAVAIEADGNIVVAGNAGNTYRASSQPILARFHPDGSLAPARGSPTDGIARLGLGPFEDFIQGMALDQIRGRFYLTGQSQPEDGSPSRLYLAAAQPDLSLDPRFGSTGITRTVFPGTTQDFGTAVAVDAKGRVVVAGSAAKPPTGTLAVERFLRNGRLDKHFGRAGRARVRLGSGWNVARCLIMQSRGRILVAGNDRRGLLVETGPGITLARLNGD